VLSSNSLQGERALSKVCLTRLGILDLDQRLFQNAATRRTAIIVASTVVKNSILTSLMSKLAVEERYRYVRSSSSDCTNRLV